MAVISWGGYRFVLRENSKVEEFYIPRLSQAQRETGVQKRSDDTRVNKYSFDSFFKGVGYTEMRRETGYGVGGLLHSTALTIHGGVFPGGLQETQSHAAPADHFKKAINFKGDLWGMFEEDVIASQTNTLECRKFGGTSDDWTGGGIIDTPVAITVGARGFDMVAHKSKLFAFHSLYVATAETVYSVSSSADAATWGNAAGTGWPDTTATNDYITSAIRDRNNFDDDMAKGVSFGNSLLGAIWRHPSSADGDGLIEVLHTTDSGSNWTSLVAIPSGDGIKAFVVWLDRSGVLNPVPITAEGIYSIDISAGTYDLLYELDGDPNNGRWSAVGNDGALYVGLGSGDILRLERTATNALEVDIINPPDGFVTATQGHVNYMLRTPTKYLVVAYGGHAASKNATVFAIDTSHWITDSLTGRRHMAWHVLYEHGTANLDIVALAYSTEDDAKPRLHIALEGTAASVNLHIEEPFTNPTQTTTKKYLDDTYIRLPDDDMGDPHTSSLVALGQVSAKNLSATVAGEFIRHEYGLEGAADTTVDLGDYLSGDKDLLFDATGSITAFADAGAGLVTVTSAAHGLVEGDIVTIAGTTSYNGTFTIKNVATNTFAIRDTWVANDATGTWVCSKGISAKTISHRLTFGVGGTNTNRPHLREFEYQTQNRYIQKRAWRFVIDMTKTADSPSKPNLVANTQTVETVKANIKTLAERVVMNPFEFSETEGVVYCLVPNDLPITYELELVDSNDISRGFTKGVCTLVLEEG